MAAKAVTEQNKHKITVWSTKLVNDYLNDIDNGIERKDSPFLYGNTQLRKPNLMFEYTQDEIEIIMRCKNDINFFANNFAYTMNPSTGSLNLITLRDYQEDLLNTINDNRFTIIVASRQCGKCSIGNEYVELESGEKVKLIDLFTEHHKNFFYKLISKLKRLLYKVYERRILKTIIGYLIQFLEYIENKNKNVYFEKFIDEHPINIRVRADSGFENASEISKTKPFEVYEIVFDDGTNFECADNHKLYKNDLSEVLCKDLNKGDSIYCNTTPKTIKKVIHHKYKFCMYDLSIDSPNHRYYTSDVLSHNTISSSIYLAWYLLFNYDKTCFLCGNIEKTAVDILGKVVDVIKNVPFFMKPGVIKGSSLEWKFDNGCRLMGAATTKRAGIGFTIHCLYLDEFAHVDKGIIDEFFDNIYPTVSSLPDSKIIVTSTPNGMNRFYHIYDAATKGINQFKPFRIDWWQVPDWDKEKQQWVLRGNDWMEKQIAQLGNGDEELGKERFGAQFGNSFLSTGNLLLGPNALKKIEETKEVFVKKPIPIFEDYDIEEYTEFLWKQDFDVENVKHSDDFFLFSIDLAEGNGGDNSVINIFKLRVMDKNDWANITVPNSVHDYVGLEQVGIFAHNRMHLQQFTKMLYILLHDVFNTENTKVVLEWNAFGGEVYNGLSHVFGDRNDFDTSCILKFKRSIDGMKNEPGLRLTHDTKLIYCHNAKKNIGTGRMILHNDSTIEELNIFGRVRSSYAAITDHDDRVMTCVNANALFDNRDFSWIADMVLEKNPEALSELTGMLNINDESVYGGFGDIYKQTTAIPNTLDWRRL